MQNFTIRVTYADGQSVTFRGTMLADDAANAHDALRIDSSIRRFRIYCNGRPWRYSGKNGK